MLNSNWIPPSLSLELNFTIPPDLVDIILAFWRSVKSIQNIYCRFLPTHHQAIACDCAAASIQCFKNGAQPIHTRVCNFASAMLWQSDDEIKYCKSENILLWKLYTQTSTRNVIQTANDWRARQYSSQNKQLNFATKYWANQQIQIRPGYVWFFSLVESQHGLKHWYLWG